MSYFAVFILQVSPSNLADAKLLLYICSVFDLLSFSLRNLMNDRITHDISCRLYPNFIFLPFCQLWKLYFSVNWIVTLLLLANCLDGKQGVVLDILVSMGIIQSHHFWLDTEHVEEAIQNVIVCVEMVFFSVLQQYAYHVAPYSGDIEAKLRLQNKNR